MRTICSRVVSDHWLEAPAGKIDRDADRRPRSRLGRQHRFSVMPANRDLSEVRQTDEQLDMFNMHF